MRFNPDGQRSNIFSIFGFLLIIWSILCIKSDIFPGWPALAPVLGSCFLIASGSEAWINKHILSRRFLVGIGLISFSLYLWHWPLLSWALIMNNGVQPDAIIRFFIVLLSFSISIFTYFFIEKPFRFYFKQKIIPIVLIFTMAIIGLTGVVFYLMKGFPERSHFINFKDEFEQLEYNLPRSTQSDCIGEFSNVGYCYSEDKPINDTSGIIIGDSHARSLFYGLNKAYKEIGGSLSFLGNHSCPPLADIQVFDGEKYVKCSSFSTILDSILKNKKMKDVFIISRGPLYIEGTGYKEVEKGIKSILALSDEKLYERSNEEVFEIALNNLFATLLHAGKRVVYIYGVPELGFEIKQCFKPRPFNPFKYLQNDCTIKIEDFLVRNKKYRLTIDKVIKNYPSVVMVDPKDIFCDSKYCYGKMNNKILYRDDDHISYNGSEILGQLIIRALPDQIGSYPQEVK